MAVKVGSATYAVLALLAEHERPKHELDGLMKESVSNAQNRCNVRARLVAQGYAELVWRITPAGREALDAADKSLEP